MKKYVLKIVAIMIILILIFSTVGYAADTETQKLKEQQKEINSQINEKKDSLDDVQAEKKDTESEIDKLNDKISSVQDEINELEEKIDSYVVQINQNEKKLKEAQKEYENQQQLLNERLVYLYQAGDTSYLDVILSSADFTDLISNWFLVSEMATYDSDMLDNIEKKKNEIEETQNKLESDRKELETSKARNQAKSVELKEAKEEKNKKVAELSETEKAIQDEIDALQEYNSKINKEIKEAEARYAAQLEALRRQQQSSSSNKGSSTSAYTGSGTFIKPVNTGTITAGMYYSSGSYHGAVDYGIPVGTPVYASAAGVVIKTANLNYSYGTYVVIQHTNGMQTWYAHGSSLVVSEGQTVSQGQLIMYSGNSGNSTGPHLHFEMRVAPYNYSNCRVNPLNYL